MRRRRFPSAPRAPCEGHTRACAIAASCSRVRACACNRAAAAAVVTTTGDNRAVSRRRRPTGCRPSDVASCGATVPPDGPCARRAVLTSLPRRWRRTYLRHFVAAVSCVVRLRTHAHGRRRRRCCPPVVMISSWLLLLRTSLFMQQDARGGRERVAAFTPVDAVLALLGVQKNNYCGAGSWKRLFAPYLFHTRKTTRCFHELVAIHVPRFSCTRPRATERRRARARGYNYFSTDAVPSNVSPTLVLGPSVKSINWLFEMFTENRV